MSGSAFHQPYPLAVTGLEILWALFLIGIVRLIHGSVNSLDTLPLRDLRSNHAPMYIFAFDNDGVIRFFAAPDTVLGVPALLILVTDMTVITVLVLAPLGAIEQASLVADRAFFGAGEAGGHPVRSIAIFKDPAVGLERAMCSTGKREAGPADGAKLRRAAMS